MATLDAGGASRQPHVPTETNSDSESNISESTSQRYDFDSRLLRRCQWRTARYHDRECSRYFDCPSHIVERALSDTEGEQGEEQGDGHQTQEHIDSDGSQDNSETGTVSPLSEDGGLRARSPSPEVQGPDRGADSAGVLSRNTPPLPTATDSSGSGHGYGSIWFPTSQASMPMPGGSGAVSGPQPTTPSGPGPAPGPTTRLISRPSPTVSTPTERRRPTEVIVLPRWQPDSEVTYCPICGTQFSIFIRKHHCRKCGRVVCNACSPHRITIPNQYIVRPPGAPLPVSQGPSLSLLDSQSWYPEFGGGERVRLCNPCVPDPNVAPPQTHGERPRPSNDHSSPSHDSNAPLSNRWSFYFGTGAPNDAQTRSRSVTLQAGATSFRPPMPPLRSNEARILWGTPPAYYQPATTSQQPHHYPGPAPRYRSMLDVDDRRPGPSTAAAAAGPSSSSTSSASRRFHSPVPPRPQIAEEDECPVCHRELPPRTLPNFESLREAHINGCIASHSRYGGGPAANPTTSSRGNDGDGDGDDPDSLRFELPRRTGMFPYTATEKDCVDSAECSICLEEFVEGVAMARLECLCRFHRACINAWWERHPGRCPMHQHDGLGY